MTYKIGQRVRVKDNMFLAYGKIVEKPKRTGNIVLKDERTGRIFGARRQDCQIQNQIPTAMQIGRISKVRKNIKIR